MLHRMRRRQFLVEAGRAVLGFSLLPVAAQAQGKRGSAESKASTAWETLISNLEQQTPKLMEETAVPGVSIAIIKDAKLAWRQAFGVKDRASKKPVESDTMFEAASMGKPVVCRQKSTVFGNQRLRARPRDGSEPWANLLYVQTCREPLWLAGGLRVISLR